MPSLKMHSRSAQSYVLFSQHRELGFRCTWRGLKKLALDELVAVCTSYEDVDVLQEGLEFFFQDADEYFSEDLAHYLVEYACLNQPSGAVNNKRCRLLFKHFKKHSLGTYATLPSFTDVIHEMLNISAKSCDVSEVARDVLLTIVSCFEAFGKAPEEYQAAISYLTEHRGVDVNNLYMHNFSSLMECLQDKLLHLCSVFSTPTTNAFLHTKLGAEKIDLLWKGVLEYLPWYPCEGSADLIRSFITNGFDVKDALFTMDFSSVLSTDRCLRKEFNDLLEILEIFMDHGARLNPLPGSNEEPFLHGVLKVFNRVFDENETRPTLYGFITKCIERGVDPKSSHAAGGIHEDLLCAACTLYNADDKKELIEYLCDCGADGSLTRNSGLDLWAQLSYRSEYELAQPRSNEILLFLLRRGLRTDCIDEDGNNVLHKYFALYSKKLDIERCCLFQWCRGLDELKFWNVLDALLGAGVQLSHVNGKGETPIDLYMQILPGNCEDGLEPICSKCSQNLMKGTRSIADNLKDRLTMVQECMSRLSLFS